MAYCFAKTQGLVLVEDNAEFLERLQKSSIQKNPDLTINGEHLVQMVSQSENVEQILPQEFLKKMCTFWFDEYYKNYINLENVENIYNKLTLYLEDIESDPNLQIDEENQFKDVNFNDFKNISENPSSIAQWFQSVYSREGYVPFTNSEGSLLPRYPGPLLHMPKRSFKVFSILREK